MTGSRTVTLAWATDLHFDCATAEAVMALIERVRESRAEALLVGGDTTTAMDLEEQLEALAEMVDMPVHFVLGNHDYYGGSMADVRRRMTALSRPGLRWLPAAGPQTVAPGITLVGHGGWGDARLGDFATSDVLLTDYFAIAELAKVFDLDRYEGVFGEDSPLERALREFGRDAAETLAPQLATAAGMSRQVMILTHVPPFREACWYGGEISGDNWLPSMSCGALGESIADAARTYPDVEFTVLCGHTHGEGRVEIGKNMVAHTQGARYEQPGFVLLMVDEDGVSIS